MLSAADLAGLGSSGSGLQRREFDAASDVASETPSLGAHQRQVASLLQRAQRSAAAGDDQAPSLQELRATTTTMRTSTHTTTVTSPQ